MFRKEKKITYRDRDEGVVESLVEAQKHSDEPLEQFLWVKNNQDLSYQQKIINMVALTQLHFNSHTFEEIKLNDAHIDLLSRAFLDALGHMQEDLPEGVYKFIYSNAADTLEEVMKQKYEPGTKLDG